MAFIFGACSCNGYTAAVAQQTWGGNQGLLESIFHLCNVRDVKTILKKYSASLRSTSTTHPMKGSFKCECLVEVLGINYTVRFRRTSNVIF